MIKKFILIGVLVFFILMSTLSNPTKKSCHEFIVRVLAGQGTDITFRSSPEAYSGWVQSMIDTLGLNLTSANLPNNPAGFRDMLRNNGFTLRSQDSILDNETWQPGPNNTCMQEAQKLRQPRVNVKGHLNTMAIPTETIAQNILISIIAGILGTVLITAVQKNLGGEF